MAKRKKRKKRIFLPKVQTGFCILSFVFVLACGIYYGSRLIKYYKIYNPKAETGEVLLNLPSKIIEETEIVEKGDGLYNINGNYVYKGQKVNNYIIVDDIQLMSPPCLAKTRQEEMLHIINGFKEMAKENNISVILFAQIRKLMEYSHKNDIKPRLEDMGESYSDYNFEDVHISFLHREAFYKRSTEDLLEFITYTNNERKIEYIQSLSS